MYLQLFKQVNITFVDVEIYEYTNYIYNDIIINVYIISD